MTSLLIILLLIVILLVFLLAAYVYLVWQKTSDRRRADKKKRWLAERTSSLEQFLFTGYVARLIVPVKEYQYEALEDLLSDFLANYKFDKDEDPIRDFVDQFFVPQYKRRLRHRRWSVRMNTLYFIDLFNIKAMQEDLHMQLSDKRTTPEESFEIYLLLAKFGSADLMQLIRNPGKMPAFLLTELVSRLMNQDNVDRFIDEFNRFDRSWQGAILEVVRDQNLRSEKLQQQLEELLESENRELRVKSLKTLASQGYVSSIDRVVRLLERYGEKGKWDKPETIGERLMAARLMGSIRDDRFMPGLKRLIADRAYNVRSEAAKSIRQYRGGKGILQNIAESHLDPYARSIAQEWMERSPDYD
ncbi:HEAT repeat domain-containing protein [Cohnella soli]|uniref:HEAT repeat domain-containing protein n=1 Tax=Cohnella soli TaxID=425005 RepID=A0ABW0HU93_9BACL